MESPHQRQRGMDYSVRVLQRQESSTRSPCFRALQDELIVLIFGYLDDPRDRSSASMVCRKWHEMDGLTRKSVYISNCYSILPAGLKRFRSLEKIKIKGKPRAYEFDLLVENWGGHAGPWICEIAQSYPKLQSLHLRRMEVTDGDLEILSQHCTSLQKLKLDKCTGFTTEGLEYITHFCRILRVLDLEESEIVSNSEGEDSEATGKWLLELLENNGKLESLNIASTSLEENHIVEALAAVTRKLKSITSLKVSDMRMERFRMLLKECAEPVVELGLGCYSSEDHKLVAASLHQWLSKLKILDLKFSTLSAEGQTEILSHCHCLEELEVRSLVGDRGMQVIGKTCKQLKRIRVDHDSQDQDRPVYITHTGMIEICEGCRELQFLVLYLSNINNEALAAVGRCLPKLTDFRIVLLEVLTNVEDLPLDNGVGTLLQGCPMLTRFSVYLRPGGLTDRGVAYIGQYGGRLKWILLGCSGESDLGLQQIAAGCQQLERLELRGCPFGEEALASAVMALPLLKYIWVQGHGATEALGNYIVKYKHGFLVELMTENRQILGYTTLASPRSDHPPSVKLIDLSEVYRPMEHLVPERLIDDLSEIFDRPMDNSDSERLIEDSYEPYDDFEANGHGVY